MKDSAYKLLLSLFFLVVFAQLSASEQNKERGGESPTVALVLSGGGAKGFAHVGILEMIDSLDIPIDYIVGTSMGSIVGGLYAIGFSGEKMEDEINKHDWVEIFADNVSNKRTPVNIKDETTRYVISFPIKEGIHLPQGIIRGQKVINLLANYTLKYHNTNDFNKLPIPFSCVAVDLETGADVVLEKGFLPQALRASMAIPSVFTPVLIDDQLLVDGGVVNNFPADVAKKKGFDFIIGVDVQTPLRKKKDLQSVMDIVSQLGAFAGKQKNDKNKKICDVYINPNVKEFTAASFSRNEIDTILKRGKLAAQKVKPQLLELKKKLGKRTRKHISSPFFEEDIHFNTIAVEGLENIESKFFIRKLKLKKANSISKKELKNLIQDLTASLKLDLLTFRLKRDTLQFIAHEKNNNRFNVGVNYNNDNNANILLNTTYYNKLFENSRLSVDAILGDVLGIAGRCSFSIKSTAMLNFSIEGRRYKPSLFEANKKVANGDVGFLRFDFNTQFLLWDSYSGGLGIREEYVGINNTISTAPGVPNNSYEWFSGYYGFIRLNTLDNKDYPTEGIRFDGEIKYLLDNKLNNAGTVLYFNLKKAYNITNDIGVVAQTRARTIIDNKTEIVYQNVWGGLSDTEYLGNNISFLGTRWIQGVNNAMATARLDLRFEVIPNNYLILSGNYGRYTDNFRKLITKESVDLWGGGVSFSYNSLIGPISLTLMQSNIVKRPLIYINIGYNF